MQHRELPQYSDVLETAERLKRDGIRCVVGGSTISEAARDLGMQSFSVEVSEGAFLQAAQEAMHYAQVLRQKDAWHDTAQSILENVREGFVFSSTQGRVLQINSAAREMFHVMPEADVERELTLKELGIP